MTREEAIKKLKSKMDGHTDTSYEWAETVRMAIQALEKENIYDDREHYITISRALYDKLIVTYDKALSQEPTDTWSIKDVADTFKKHGLIREQEPCDDAISREMALEKMADYAASGYADSAEDFEEYSRIICQLPFVTQKPIECDDAVSRQAVIQMFDKWLAVGDYNFSERNIMNCAIAEIEDLPPVRPQEPKICEKCLYAEETDGSHCYECVKGESKFEPKTGHWMAVENEEMETIGHYCSECDLPMETDEQTHYCPNCGAKMVEPQESEDK